MKRLLCFLTGLLLIIGSANAQCITMNPSNFNAVADGNLHKYEISFPHANLDAEKLYSLHYELLFRGEAIPDDSLSRYIDVDTSYISALYSPGIPTAAHFNKSAAYFPSLDLPLELVHNISGQQVTGFYGQYLSHPQVKLTFAIRWLKEGDFKLRLSLYSMNGGSRIQTLTFLGQAFIGASGATVGSEVMNNDIVTPKELDPTVIYICHDETFQRGNWKITDPDTVNWTGTINVAGEDFGCQYVTRTVEFRTNDGACANNRLDSTQVVTLKRRPAFTATLNGTTGSTTDNRVICSGTSAGYVYMTIQGNSTYAVTNGTDTLAKDLSAGTAVKVGDLSVGNYQFKVTDAHGCSIDVNQSVEISESPNANTYTINETITHIVCYGDSTGRISVSGVPAQDNQTATPYQYSWSNNKTGTVIENLTAGNYTVKLTDNMGCTASKTITVNQNAELKSKDTVSCCYSELPYHYSTQNGDTIFTTAGTKVVAFKSVNNCDSMVTVTLIVYNNPTVTISKNINDNSICTGQETATLTAVPVGGTGTIEYQWMKNGSNITSATASTYEVSTLGSYNVVVKDSAGCTATATEDITITENAVPDISASTLDASICNGQETTDITTSLTVGTADSVGASYIWYKGTTEIAGATSDKYTATEAGSYKVVFIDAQGCKDTSNVITVTVNSLPQITISTADSSICDGQETANIIADFTAGTAGGNNLTYQWLKEEDVIANATASNYVADAAGSYRIVVIDDQNCKDTSDAVVITVNTLPQITISTPDTSICNGQETAVITATLVDGTAGHDNVTYAWFNGTSIIPDSTSNTYTASAAGSYKITVVDGQNCKDTSNVVVVTVNTLPTMVITTDKSDNSICEGQETITLTAVVTAGTADFNNDYSWSTSETAEYIEVDGADTYKVTATDAEGCTVEADTTIVVNELPAVTISTQTPIICDGNTATITSNVTAGTAGITGMEYHWTKDSVAIDTATLSSYGAVEAGSYSLSIKDAQGCTAKTTSAVTITINPLVELDFTGDTTQTICAEDSISTILITFDNATIAVSGLPTGISFNNVVNKISGTCNVPGTYHYQVVATSNQTPACDPVVKTGTITVNAKPTISFNATSETICSGDDFTIAPSCNGTATLTYQWYKGTQLLTDSTHATLALEDITSEGTYHVVVTDGNVPACSTTSPDFTIYVNTNPTVHISNVANGTAKTNEETCLKDSITLFAVSTSTVSSYQWYKGTEAIPGATANNLPLNASTLAQAGKYTVKISDNQTPQCKATSDTITVIIDTLPQPTISGDDAVCATSTDFPTFVALTTLDGQNLTYNWSLSNNGTYTGTGKTINASWSAAASVTASVTVTDGNGCKNTAEKNITVNDLPTAQISNNNASICLGQESTTLTATNGTGYQFAWNNNATTATITVQPSVDTTYTVIVTDGNGCQAKDSLQITINQLPVVSASTADSSICPGQQNATITVSLTTAGTAGGTGLTYAWYSSQTVNDQTLIAGQTSNSYTATAAGSYTVKVTDTEGCWATSYVPITENELPTVTITTDLTDNDICPGQETVKLTAVGQGGTGALGYQWKKGTSILRNADTCTVAAAGTYTIIVTDAQTCTVKKDTTIVENELPTVAIASDVVTDTCAGSIVAITLNTSNNVTAYCWKNNQDSLDNAAIFTFTLDADTTFNVTVKTDKGCTASTQYNGHAYELPIITSIVPTAALCNGDANGKVMVSVTNGTPQYTFRWTDGAVPATTLNYTTQNITTAVAGDYQVEVTDAHHCVATSAVVTVTEPDLLTGITTTVEDVKCYSGDDGSIKAHNVHGGTPVVIGNNAMYLYKLVKVVSTGDSVVRNYSYDSTFNNLNAGSYKIYVKDNNGCIDSTAVTVNEPNQLAIIISDSTSIDCYNNNNGTLGTTTTGGTAPYSYAWSNTKTTANIDNLTAGTYTVIVTDDNNCTATASKTLANPDELTIAITDSISILCHDGNNGKLIATANGGTVANDYTYAWSNNKTTATIDSLTAGTYTITVTDDNQCTATASQALANPTLLTATITDSTKILCHGGDNGTFTVTAEGGTPSYSYAWSNNDITATADTLTAGTYTVTVTDNNGCTVTASQTLGEPEELAIIISDSTSIDCYNNNNGTLSTSTTGGTTPYSYAWSNTKTTANIDNLTAGTYTVIVTDDNSCTATASKTLANPDELTIAITDSISILCHDGNNGKLIATANGGTVANDYTYAWSNNKTTATIDSLTAGTYTITVTDDNQCTATASQALANPTLLTATITDSTKILCHNGDNGTLTVTADGGTPSYSYAWSNNDITATADTLTAGTYTVTVTDNNGCTATASQTLSEPEELTVTISDSTSIDCYNNSTGTLGATATGGITPYSYAWSNNKTTAEINNLSAGTYTVTVTDNNNCTATDSHALANPERLTISESSVTTDHVDVSCNGLSDGEFVVVATGGTQPYLYKLGNNEPQSNGSYNSLSAGQYNVVVTDNKGCTADTTITITEPAVTTVTLNNDTAICLNQSVTLTAVSFTENTTGSTAYYTWSPASAINGAFGTVTPTQTTTYKVTFTDAHGCQAVDSIKVTVNTLPVVEITEISDEVCPNIGTLELTATITTPTTGDYKYTWYNGFTVSPNTTTTSATTNTVTATIPAANNITYLPSVKIVDANGCEAADTITVVVKDTVAPVIARRSAYNTGIDAVQTGNCGYAVPVVNNDTYFEYSDNCTVNGFTLTQAPTANTAITTDTTVTVTVTDSCGNTAQATIKIVLPTELQVTASADTAICYGDTAHMRATATEGTEPVSGYTYKWYVKATNTEVTSDVHPTTTTTYKVVATDDNGCTAEDSVKVTVNPLPVVDTITTVDSAVCPYCGTFEVTAAVTSNYGPFTYNWTGATATATAGNATVTETATVTVPQDYTVKVKVTDANGCLSAEKSVVITVTDDTDPVISDTIASHELTGCDANVLSTYPAYTTVADLEANFNLAISDNCTADADLVVTSSDDSTATCPIKITRTYKITDKCGNFATVAQTIYISKEDNITFEGGKSDSTIACMSDTVAPHTYVPSVMPTVKDACGEIISDFTSYTATQPDSCGNTKVYTYTYTDCAGHTNTWDFTFNATNDFTPGSIGTTDTTICFGGNGGVIASVTDAQACSNIEYMWQKSTNGTTWNTIANSNSASYTPDSLTVTTYFRRAAKSSCDDWQFSEGERTVTVKPDVVITNHTVDGSVCPDSSYVMSVTATGGVGTLTYTWYAGSDVIAGATTDTYTATNINANTTYKCVVAGIPASGCAPAEETVEVTLYTPATLTLVEDFGATALCPDSAFHFTATTGLNDYVWKVKVDGVEQDCTDATGNTYVTLGKGTFVVDATDTNNCGVHSDSITVTRYEAPVGDGWAYVNNDQIHKTNDTSLCKGTDITLVGFSATANTHIWTSGTDTLTTTTFAPEATATYTVVSVDEHGCKSNPTTVDVTVDSIPVVTLTGNSNNNTNVSDNITVCYYDDATLTATSAATIDHWLFGNDSTIATNSITYIENMLTPEVTGRYIVYVKDSKNCVGSDTINFTIRDEISVVASSDATNDEICYGSDLTLDVTSTDITNFTWAAIGADSVERTIQNATTSGNAITFAADTTATYRVSGFDANNCRGYADITVTVDTLPTVTVTELANGIICADSTFHFTATGDATLTYSWKYNNVDMTGETATTLRDTRAGKYVVNVTDGNNCVGASDTIETVVNPLPIISIYEDYHVNTICADSAFHFTATSGLSDYTWQLDGTEIAGANTQNLRATAGGTYTVRAMDANNCYNTQTITVTVNELPSVVLSEDYHTELIPVICSDSAFHFTATVTTNATDPTTYTWKRDNVQLTNTASTLRDSVAGKYVVDIIDGNGCESHSDTMEVSVNPVPEVTVNHMDISCQDLGSASITVTSAGSYTCNWNNTMVVPMTTAGYSATDLTQGWYPYNITNTATNCALIDSVYIDNPGAISATVIAQLDNNFESCEGSNYIVDIAITGGNPAYTLEWVNEGQVVDAFRTNSHDTTYNFGNLEDGEYTLTLMITDTAGCTGSTDNDFVITIYPSYDIVREINIAKGQTSYTYDGQQYTVPNVPDTIKGYTTHGCDSIISYELHQYELDILIADTCTMTRSSYTRAYKNEPRTLYNDTIYVKTGEQAEFFAYIANTEKTNWNGDSVDMTYEVLYNELPVEDEDMADVISALRFSTYYDRNGVYFGIDSVMSTQGEIPASTFAFRANNNSAIQHFDYFFFDAYKNVPNKVEFTPLENGTYTFKFKVEVRHSGHTGTNWPGIFNPYISGRGYGHLYGGHDDTPATKDTIAARVFTVIATADGVAPTNAATNIDEYSNEASVRTYPNPVRDQLNIRVSGMEGQTAITITDAQGKTIRVYNVNLDGSDAVMTYDMNGLAQGMYFINVRNNEKMISQKFILSK